MSDGLASDLRRFAFGLGAFAVAVVAASGFWLGRATDSETVKVLREERRVTDSVYVVRTDTVVKIQRRVDTVRARSDSADANVAIIDSVTVRVADTVAVVPGEVVGNIAALRLTVATQDTLILALYQRDTTQQWRIATRDKLIRELSKPTRCGRRCGFLLGVGASVLVYKAVK